MYVNGSFGSSLATLEPVIQVQIADGAQSQVVVVDSPNRLAKLFIECMQSVQVGRRGGNFKLAGAQEFLIPAVDQSGDFAANQAAGPDHIDGAALWGSGQHGAAAIFADLHLICDSRRVRDIKVMGAEVAQGAIERLNWGAGFLAHRNID